MSVFPFELAVDTESRVVDGESAARYIKSTNNRNTHTPIIAVSAYSSGDEQNGLFAASLSKPLQRADLLAVMRKLGFKTSAVQGVSHAPVKFVSSRVS